MGNSSGHVAQGAFQHMDNFPWHLLPKRTDLNVGHQERVFAVEARIGMGTASRTVSRKLDIGMGSVECAYVFDNVHVGMGYITELHCLKTTKVRTSVGQIHRKVYHSVDELVALSMQVCQVAAVTVNLLPGWTTEKTKDGKTYYLDHNTKTSHWVLPSTAIAQPGTAGPQPVYNGGQGTSAAPQYPPQQQNYPQQYPPQQQQYPPQQQQYPPQQQQYPPQQMGQAPPVRPNPPSSRASASNVQYPPAVGTYPPASGAPPPQYAPEKGAPPSAQYPPAPGTPGAPPGQYPPPNVTAPQPYPPVPTGVPPPMQYPPPGEPTVNTGFQGNEAPPPYDHNPQASQKQ